ncbi:hypothetical protein T484DRAFT_2024817 [Baffinella frigidus]|nr:hypothetical protein T484DRAFT_2024817 [Cryptophyta sp. CCMP2293]
MGLCLLEHRQQQLPRRGATVSGGADPLADLAIRRRHRPRCRRRWEDPERERHQERHDKDKPPRRTHGSSRNAFVAERKVRQAKAGGRQRIFKIPTVSGNTGNFLNRAMAGSPRKNASPATIPHAPCVAIGAIARMVRLLAVAGILFLATTAGAPQGEETRGIGSGGDDDAGAGAGRLAVEGAGEVKRSSRAVVSSMTLEDDEMSDEPLVLKLPPELQALNGDDCYDAGEKLLLQGRSLEAATLLARAAELMPGDAFAHGNLAIALHQMGRSREATPHFRGQQPASRPSPSTSRTSARRSGASARWTRRCGCCGSPCGWIRRTSSPWPSSCSWSTTRATSSIHGAPNTPRRAGCCTQRSRVSRPCLSLPRRSQGRRRPAGLLPR